MAPWKLMALGKTMQEKIVIMFYGKETEHDRFSHGVLLKHLLL